MTILDELKSDLPERLKPLFEERKVLLAQLAETKFATAAKALDVGYDRDFIFQEMVIYNDLRPIFVDESEGTKLPNQICGFVNGFECRINYYKDGRVRTLSLFADVSDIEKIEYQCRRAIKKLALIKEYMKRPHSAPLLLIGEDDDVIR